MADRDRILSAILSESRYIRNPHAREVFKRAAVQTGLVETNLRNLPGGDADSQGWRQERKSLYPNPRNIEASARRFRQEFQQHFDPGEKSYEVAAQVQRPAAQYRGRYKERAKDAEGVLKGSSVARTTSVSPATTTVPGVDNSRQRAALVAAFLSEKKADPVGFALGIKGLQDVPGQTVTGSSGSAGAPGSSPQYGARADTIDKQRLPYKWGGGHQGRTPIKQAVPLDCSGAVSKVLGINPRVSGQFQQWGKPGDGGSRGVTVYSNAKHVLMKIDGKFFGTSKSNPQGGAGWIPQSQISPEYLAGFTVRHA